MRLYRALASLALAAYAPFALARSLAGKRRFGDIRGRLGKRPYPDLGGGVWIHAVSVGEVGVARNLIRSLRPKLPGRPLGVSVTTAAGRELAAGSLSAEAAIFAFPFDLAGAVERSLSRTRPAVIVLVETEIWPLFLDRAASLGIPVALVNGRISSASFARYRLAGRFFRRTLSRIALFAMQSDEDARRIEALGAPRERIVNLGNIKYDLPEPPPFPDSRRLAETAAGRPLLVAGSTGEGEEALVLDAWSALPRRPLLLLAPRRPERFDEVARLGVSRGLTVVRRSRVDNLQPATDNPPDVYLLDSIGELASVYREAALAFVGGSLIDTGGQNPIEAWAAGVPVLAGPHMENFREIAARGQELGFLTLARDASDLSLRIAEALADPGETSRRGAAAERFVAANRGAAERTSAAIVSLLPALSGRRASAP